MNRKKRPVYTMETERKRLAFLDRKITDFEEAGDRFFKAEKKIKEKAGKEYFKLCVARANLLNAKRALDSAFDNA